MSTRWPGGIISQTAPVPSGPYQNSTASGVWTMEQQAYFQQQGLWPIPGNINTDAFIENLFSTYLYTGNGSSQTINNSINLAGKGGLVWVKGRSSASPQDNHELIDTVRGVGKALITNITDGQYDFFSAGSVSAFNSNGFSLNGPGPAGNRVNGSSQNVCSWTFREQPKFFDIVTYTGNATNRTIAHNLGSVPGMIIVKKISGAEDWFTYHRSTGATQYLKLNDTDGASGAFAPWNNTAPTSTVFSISSRTEVNQASATYIAYLFAHDAGGFGASGTDNVISCGSYTGSASPVTITLGYEPQWVMLKRTSGAGNWVLFDTMRGMSNTTDEMLFPNLSNAADPKTYPIVIPTATGFTVTANNGQVNGDSATYIYMAIRRPMAVPTVATTVFNPVYGQSGAPGFRSSNFNAGVDTAFYFYPAGYNDGTNAYPNLQNRLIGTNQLQTPNTRAELSLAYNTWDYMNGVTNLTSLDTSFGSWMFKRASGFHDVVCYTGNAPTNTQITHNLGVAPELIIAKSRSIGGDTANWAVYHNLLGINNFLTLNANSTPVTVSNYWSSTAPTATTFGIGSSEFWNNNGNMVAYLFATCPGVSKVGSYTGNGALTTIDCGFTGGARFVLIKRTDSTGDWYVWDTTRGMVAGTNPSLTLNTYAAQVNANSVYTIATGFQLLASPAVPVNNSGASYIFLAIA